MESMGGTFTVKSDLLGEKPALKSILKARRGPMATDCNATNKNNVVRFADAIGSDKVVGEDNIVANNNVDNVAATIGAKQVVGEDYVSNDTYGSYQPVGSDLQGSNSPPSEAVGAQNCPKIAAVHEGLVKPAVTYSNAVVGVIPRAVDDQQQADLNVGENNPKVSEEQASGGTKKVNFRALVAESIFDGADVVLPSESVRVVKDRLEFTLFGYFLGDRIAYPVVDYFARQNWVKYGLQKSMMNANGFFFFKFADEKGMLAVLEGGPWLIRKKPILLNCWSPTTQMTKNDITNVAVWVKMHNIPLAAYTDDGLSLIATKIGNPKRLDSYTSAMCTDTWGRSSYARALIEVSAAHDLKDAVIVAIPELEGDKFVTETVDIEYEWNPPRCSHCCVFGHLLASCPKQAAPTPNDAPKVTPKTDDQGFTHVQSKNVSKRAGFKVQSQKPRVEYMPKTSDTGKAKKSENANVASTRTVNYNTSQQVSTSNTFSALSGDGRVNSQENEEYDEESDIYSHDGYDGYDMGDFMVEGIDSKKKKGKDAGKVAGTPLIKRGFLG